MEIADQLSSLPPSSVQAGVAISIAAGTLYCFFGYRLLKFVIGFTGFLLAGASGAFLGQSLSHGHVVVTLAAAIIGGCAGAFALLFLYKVGIFFIGVFAALLGALVAFGGRTEDWIPWAIVGTAVVGGLIALIMERPIIMLATAAIGAWMLVTGIAYFVIGPTLITNFEDLIQLGNERFVVIVSWAVLTAAGTLNQLAMYRRRPSPPAPPRQ
ncbi:MAG: DUF4203 domain-containing protein [Candidatus Hydrogenedentes bacterium]|nr:DUF4203 domain-containing protein [Candidatus Hydrogenedentota bacterium]